MGRGDGSERESWWSLTCELLGQFTASDPASAPNAQPTPRYDAWVAVQHAAEALLGSYDTLAPAPSRATTTALRALVAERPDVPDAAHAVAWLLDERYGRTFPDDWLAGAGAPLILGEGDAYPVLPSPWTIFHPFLSEPAAMTDPGLDELPHLRRHRPSDRQRGKVRSVEVHPVPTLLRDALVPLQHIATGHPNVSWKELTWPAGRRLWPVTVVDPKRQDERHGQSVAEALGAGCGLVVLPELSATDRTAGLVQALLDDHYDKHEEAVLVTAGSRHVDDGAGRRNVAQTHIAGVPFALQHDKLVPFRHGEAIEGLNATPPLRLYQDGPFRFAVVICKDLLDSDIRNLLGTLGVNVLAVPAMSSKTANFPLALDALLSAAQTVCVVANGPLSTTTGAALARCSLSARPTAAAPLSVWSTPPAQDVDGPVWILHPLAGGEPTVNSLTGR